MNIKKGSKVKILVGKDKNKEGEIIEINRAEFRAKVKGLNLIKKHVKTTKEKKGGIFEKEKVRKREKLALVGEKRNVAYPQFSDHYFTGDYPIKLSDKLKGFKVRQLSLLSGKSNS